MSRRSNVEDIYPLSPVQQGMLFHGVYDPRSSAYFEQLVLRVPAGSDLDMPALGRALALVIELHSVLRTAFVWERGERPLQVVMRSVRLPLAVHDLRSLGPDRQEAAVARYLAADRERGFELAREPLLRAAVVRLAAGPSLLVFSYHHILLDGWSVRRVFDDLFAAYRGVLAGAEPRLPRPRPFRDYIDWLGAQSMEEARNFWRRALAGFTALTLLDCGEAASAATEPYAERRVQLAPAACALVKTFARRQHLTLNTVAQAAWALLLGRYSCRRDVVFGMVVADRPDDLPGAEEIVGLLINTLPVRVRVAGHVAVGDWLRELQAGQLELRRYQHAPLVQIQRWSEVPPGQPLFETLFDFESYPQDGRPGERDDELLRPIASFDRTHYPLTADVRAEPDLAMSIAHDQRRFDAAMVERVLEHWRNLVESMAADPARPVDALPLLRPSEMRAIVLAQPAAGDLDAEALGRRLAALELSLGHHAAGTEERLADVLHGVEIWLVDPWGQLVPPGVPGEICLAGAAVSEGRLPQAGPTAARFVPEPWSERPGARLLRTGQMARHRPGAGLEVVTGRPLAARRVKASPGDRAGSGLAPRDELETALAEVWARVLRRDRVGIEEDFFAAGGDSILSLQVLARARDRGIDFTLQQLFRCPTVERLAREISGDLPPARPEGPANAAAEIAGTAPLSLLAEDDRQALPDGVEDAYPLTSLQGGMLYHSSLAPEAPTYQDLFSYRLRAPLEEPALREALRRLAARHPVLRTSFDIERFGEPLQLVAREAEVDLTVADLRAGPPAPPEASATPEDAERRFSAWYEAEVSRPLDWARPGLLRFHVHRWDAETFQLSLTLHHAILDGWSIALMLTELFQIYSHLLGRAPAPPPPPAAFFRDFVALERAALASGESRTFWLQALSGASRTELPRWGARRQVAAGPAACRVSIPAALLQRLETTARAAAAPLKSVFLAAHLRVLGVASGRPEVLTGVVVNGRPEAADGERVLGLFLNTVPLWLRPAAGSWLDFVRQTFDAECALLPHRRFPLGEIQRAVGGPPLFTAVFNFIRFHVYESVFAPAGLEVLSRRMFEQVDFPLAVNFRLSPAGDGGELSLDYDPEELWPAQVAALAGSYERALAALAAEPEARWDAAVLLAASERHQLLVEAQDSAVDFGPVAETAVEHLFEAQVARTPELPAILCGGEVLSYRELDARAEALAERLRARGVAPEVTVGLFLHRTPDLLVALLAVLKAGGTYLPLDPAYPAERLAMILADAAPRLVLTEQLLRDRLAAHPGEALLVAPPEVVRPRRRRRGAAPTARAGGGTMDRLAYILFTSGSTGRPKGVAVAQRSLVNLLAAMRERPGFEAGDRLLAVTTLSFDIAGLEVLLPLLCGGTLVLARGDETVDGESLRALLAASGATVMQATPSTWRLLLEAGWTGGDGLKVLCGGEPWPPELASRLSAAAGSVWNMYGPTETTIWSAVHPLPLAAESDPAPAAGAVPLGRAIANTHLYLLAADLSPVPLLVPGELYIGGTGVARAYLGRPDLTAERFLPDPWGGEGARMYRTGDVVHRRPDGCLEFRGRVDSQVKLRGFRVELGEIEGRLAAHPAVSQAAAAVWEEKPGDQRLVAYLVGTALPRPGSDELRGLLRRSLPEFMLPAAFVWLDSLPLTPNGKLDRKALPRGGPLPFQRRFSRELSLLEQMVAEVWGEVLGIAPQTIDASDNFFELGGHSLLATRLLARLRRGFGVELSLRHLVERPTLGELANQVAAGPRGAPLPELPRGRRSQAPPLSYAQEQLWVIQKMHPESAAYNLPAVVRIAGPLSAWALSQALDGVAARHEVLRSRFPEKAGRCTVEIVASVHFQLGWIDLSGLPSPARQGTLHALAQAEAMRPFDLAVDLPVRGALLRLGVAEHVLLLTLHHIVSDERSNEILLREVSTLYAAALEERPSGLPDLPFQYGDFAHWQREGLAGEAFDTQLSYWRGQLAGAPPLLDLPADHPRPAVQTLAGDWVPCSLSPALTRDLRQLARRGGGTLFTVLLAGFQALLGRLAGVEDLVVGASIAGRRAMELEDLIGLFLNVLALRADLSGPLTVEGLLRQARETALAAYAHQDVPFEKLVAELQVDRDPQRSPLLQVMLVFQNFMPASAETASLVLEPLPASVTGSKFDLSLFIAEREGALDGHFVFNRDLFAAPTVARFAAAFERLLEAAVADPRALVSELPLMAPAARHQVLIEWSQPALAPEEVCCLHHLFERQVERTPESVALVSGRERLSYRDLDRRAGRLARRLRAAGVGPERVVALCLHRGAEMMIAMLGVLKAGGAYMPIDAGYPRERVQLLLEDSAAALLLTQEDLLAALPARHPPALCLASEGDGGPDEEGEPVPPAVVPENLAYVIYTSGSTGRPKGVMMPHRGVVAYLLWARARLGLDRGWGAPVQSALGFDLTVTSLLVPLVAGKAVEILPEGDPIAALAGARAEPGPFSLVKLTPSQLELLDLHLSPADLPGWAALLVIGGERLVWSKTLSRWRRLAPETRVINHYGPTEAAVGCCFFEVGPVEPAAGSVLPIGRPILGARLFVADRGQQPVPIGVPGELLIGGRGLSRGYLGQPQVTAERFVPSFAGEGPGERLYRTGDLVRFRPDGNLEFMGRVDHQVKIRGYRVELAEVEATLSRHPAIREAAVGVRTGAAGTLQLFACLVAASGPLPANEIEEFLAELLPSYMLPSAYVFLEALPVNAHGKVDRRRLPVPEPDRDEERTVHVAPSSALERRLAELISQVLKVEQVGVHDSFFQLGGDSILSIILAAKAVREGIRITPQQVFQHPTAARLAALAAPAGGPSRAPAATGEIPLTPIQRWFFALELATPEHFNQAVLFEVDRRFDARVFTRALAAAIAHHDAFRLRFASDGPTWSQRCVAPADEAVPFTRLDLSALPEDELRPVIERAAAALQGSLDLARGPLLRAMSFEVGGGGAHRLLIVIHHLAVDGVSWRVLLADLEALYAEMGRGEEATPLARTSSFKEWAECLARHGSSPELRGELPYWERLGTVPPLPLDFPATANLRAAARSITVELDAEETRALIQDLPTAYHAQIQELLLAALAHAIHRWAGHSVVLIELEGHGREPIAEGLDLTHTVGWFTSRYPVRLGPLADGPEQALLAVKEALRAVPRNGIGFGLLRYLCPDREVAARMSALPCPPVVFNYLGQFGGPASSGELSSLRLAGESFGPLSGTGGLRTHLLEVNGSVVAGVLRFTWTHSVDLHRQETVRALASSMLDALRRLVEGCDNAGGLSLAPSDFPLAEIDAGELARLSAWVDELDGAEDGTGER